jgi:hypothetical protein
MSSADSEEDEYEVEAILDKKIEKGQVWYKLKWLDWSNVHNSWEPAEGLHCTEIIEAFEAAHADAPKPTKRKRSSRTVVKTESAKTVKKAKKQKLEEPDEEDTGDEYEVEAVVDERCSRITGVSEFLVRWKGFTAAEDTWEEACNLVGSRALVSSFRRQHPIPRNAFREQVA